MSESDDEGPSEPAEPPGLPAVAARLNELRRRKRKTVRWHMSRETAERAIAAIADGARTYPSGRGKSRRRKRYKRLL